MDGPLFEILEVRSVGAYATVCRGRRKGDALNRDVALKVLRSALVGNARALARTRDEARLLAKLNHPGIVRMEDLLSYDRRPVLVMEWLDGMSLRELLERRRSGLPTDIVLAIVLRIVDALEAGWNARDSGGRPLRIVHRDLKPANVIITIRGEVKVVDFGLSRGDFYERETSTVSTVLGSMGYMAPERWERGESDHTGIDVYALGLTLFELLTGKLPILPRDSELHQEALFEATENLSPEGWTEADCASLRALCTWMGRWDPEARPSYTEVRFECERLFEASGNELVDFAASNVIPAVAGLKHVPPKQHPLWEEVSFLEGLSRGDDLTREPTGDAERSARADVRVRRFLEDSAWVSKKRELKWLLALEPGWTAAPFVEVLERTTLPWWVFWVRSATEDEVALSLELLRHRPVPRALEFAQQLQSHENERVGVSAREFIDAWRAFCE